MAEPSLAAPEQRDWELVRRAQAGDGDALVELVRSKQSYVYSIALGVMRDPADAADMTQEAFVRVFRSLHTYRGETKFTTWLYRLATNVCLDGLRRRGRPVDSLDADDEERRHLGQTVADHDPSSQPEDRLVRRESAEEVRAAVSRLPTAQRLALTLHYFEDMRYEDVAAAMDLPLNTVKSHIRRGKERLAAMLTRVEDRNETERMPCGALT